MDTTAATCPIIFLASVGGDPSLRSRSTRHAYMGPVLLPVRHPPRACDTDRVTPSSCATHALSTLPHSNPSVNSSPSTGPASNAKAFPSAVPA